MIPLRDENPTVLTPFLTLALIALNVIVWIYLQGAGFSGDVLLQSVCRYGIIPAEITQRTGEFEGIELAPGAVCRFGGLTWPTVATSMFLHGGWLHLIGNMWFLWLFGNNIEDSMGHLRFLVFYLLTGLAAGAAHIWSAADSPVPTVGASGAISGVMGAYLILYPRVRIHTLFILFVFIRIIPIPAWFVLAEWFVVQFLAGSTTPVVGGGEGGVAYWAHIGGFVVGLVAVKLFENRTLVEARKRHLRLSPFEVEHRGWW
ncbi:MAG: rhomboid family intramembrane serine protease [Gemmatimonadetes bacterium]|nr:rhomboid family intramembrane serine protease [Gemmatimonadota bacterium]